jgi:hypothetical protein
MIPLADIKAAITTLQADTAKVSERVIAQLSQNAGDARQGLFDQITENNLWISVYSDIIEYLFERGEAAYVPKDEFNNFLFTWMVQLASGTKIGQKVASGDDIQKLAIISGIVRDMRFGNRAN